MKNDHIKLFKRILTTLILLTLLFIWGNSCLTRAQSTAVSDFVMRLLGIERGPRPDETVHSVRKMGHFLEFLALGVELMLFGLLRRVGRRETMLSLGCCGLLCPLLDETVQIFSGRSPEVVDVWIDVAGFSLGCLTVLLIFLLWTGWKRRAVRRSS